MEEKMSPYLVYVLADDANRIIAVNSSAFLTDAEGWVLIDQGYGDRYHHAQGNYLPGDLVDDRGLCRYKLTDGVVEERTQEEIDADYIPPTSNDSGDLAAQVAALQAQVDEQAKQLAAYEAAYKEGVQSA